ncbi:NAD-dependent epimerase/dehydratase family protein [Aeromicrobium chenweiae]|uniref:Epimerase n=1 Tax=Aeromicrobium chenweiae TaxID=2079793 RepID=A0A2S0WK65_9ACTN|nr:NAD-dependent epimerase/dehydratase family protein [Aeromicrobium chenweiae]AWB91721.1 epimerase [Aeromicrobium chenweiae]TGN32562.1 NAD-dependent epimerase/dehydratase family protein [Aeromicrobium chenweiae]
MASPRADSPADWIVGAHGMLGSAVTRAAEIAGHTVHLSHVPWGDPARAVEVLAADAQRILTLHDDVTLLWCAGAGVVATTPEMLAVEVETFRSFMTELDEAHLRHRESRVRVFLASSAGGVYAGSAAPPFTESTAPIALAPYGEAKLANEEAVRRLADHGVSVLIGRLSNLYGPGQDLSKPQGVISQLCRAQWQRSPMTMYVSLDTTRDYLFVGDAAQMVLAGSHLLSAEPDGTVVVKILASQAPASLALIIGELRRVSRRRAPIVVGTSPNARFQAKDLRFRSEVWPSLDHLASTPLPAGIHATLQNVSEGLRR